MKASTESSQQLLVSMGTVITLSLRRECQSHSLPIVIKVDQKSVRTIHRTFSTNLPLYNSMYCIFIYVFIYIYKKTCTCIYVQCAITQGWSVADKYLTELRAVLPSCSSTYIIDGIMKLLRHMPYRYAVNKTSFE